MDGRAYYLLWQQESERHTHIVIGDKHIAFLLVRPGSVSRLFVSAETSSLMHNLEGFGRFGTPRAGDDT